MRTHARQTGTLLTSVAEAIVSGTIDVEELLEASGPGAPR
jgi:hypothetical protein